MSTVGQTEKRTQQRVVALFQEALGYEYLGNWKDRDGNANIEASLVREYLQGTGRYDDNLITRALHQLTKAAGDASKSLYERNKAVYELLRFGVKVKPDVGENTETVWLIDWKHPERNHFAIAEEVAIAPATPTAHAKRPDVVLYVNGIALGVLELKRSTVSVAEGIRQNLDNQSKPFIPHFFATTQLLMAGNDTEGLRYGTILTPEKHYLTWKEDGPGDSPLDRHLAILCQKSRFLELIHDFIVFDAGIKKLCRHNQYFGVKAAQKRVADREGGIIWHTQGSGKSLTMVWLAKWIRENIPNARVLIITDRTELDDQIEQVFQGVQEEISRTQSGADLIAKLNAAAPWLLCSLVHKFGGKDGDDNDEGDIPGYVEEVRRALPPGFSPKGDIFVFVDECHRTQSGDLHKAMKAILPGATFIGFTGTPLLQKDKKRSEEIFGSFIHRYQFHEAVADGVVLDLRYEARDINQRLTSHEKIDQWFESKTKGLTTLAKAQLKQRWGTIQKVLSSQSRLEQIVADILLEMETRDRLKSCRGNAMLVAGSIYEACKFWELFSDTPLQGKCAVITSYIPNANSIKGEESGEGYTERLRQYKIYGKMLGDWYNQPAEQAIARVEEFEKTAKTLFVKEPGRMKLLIVVDKLLTGFDAPSATYLYIDKQMRDHGLFQAICRVNRLDGDDKDFGYIVDYKDLFENLKTAMRDFTRGAFDGYEKSDVAGLLKDRLGSARASLEEAREAVKAVCEPVAAPRDTAAYIHYFCKNDQDAPQQVTDKEQARLALYRYAANLVRAYANLANEMDEAGYSIGETATIKAEVTYYEKVRNEIKLASGDYIDLKMYEPAMRHLIDSYIQADASERISAFDNFSLVQLLVDRGPDAVGELPEDIRKDPEAVAETVEGNVRKVVIDKHPINPKYFDKMSELLESLIQQRRRAAISYTEYLAAITDLARKVTNPEGSNHYPAGIATAALRALYDNLEKDEARAMAVHEAIQQSRQDDWRANAFKIKKVRLAIQDVLGDDDDLIDAILELAKNQDEY